MRGQSAKLPSLDMARFVAAAMVALFHLSYIIYDLSGRVPFSMAFRSGHAGVEFFFVLSGFIILYVHRGDIGKSNRLGGFLWKRIARIVPGLWLILIPWGILSLVASDRGSELTPLSVLMDVLLIPHHGPVLINLTWTLQREVVFYTFFAFLLINARLGLVLLVIWQVAIISSFLFSINLGLYGTKLLGLNNIGFGLGMLIALYFNQLTWKAHFALLIGAAMFVGAMAAAWWVGGPFSGEVRPLGLNNSILIFTAAAFLLVLGLVARDKLAEKSERPMFELLGGASYILYLVHAPVGSVMMRALLKLRVRLSGEVMLIILTVAAVVTAIVLHWYIERPIINKLRRWKVKERETITAGSVRN